MDHLLPIEKQIILWGRSTALESCDKSNTPLMQYHFTKCKVIDVYDGDTITIAAHHYGCITRFSVRIYGIDCAEMRGGTEETKQLARRAKQIVQQAILGKIVDIEVLTHTLDNKGRPISDVYGRLIANVKTPDGQDVSKMLISMNLANPYFGGTKEK